MASELHLLLHPTNRHSKGLKVLLKANACAALLLLTAGQPRRCFHITYHFPLGLLAGSFNGTLQGDDNTFVITSVVPTPTLSGTPGTPIVFVDSLDNLSGSCQGLFRR